MLSHVSATSLTAQTHTTHQNVYSLGRPCKNNWTSWQSLLHHCFAKCMKPLCMLFTTGERQGAWEYPTYEPDYLRKAREQQTRRSSLQRLPSERHTRGRLGAVSFQDREEESHYIPVDFGCRSWWKRRRRMPGMQKCACPLLLELVLRYSMPLSCFVHNSSMPNSEPNWASHMAHEDLNLHAVCGMSA